MAGGEKKINPRLSLKRKTPYPTRWQPFVPIMHQRAGEGMALKSALFFWRLFFCNPMALMAPPAPSKHSLVALVGWRWQALLPGGGSSPCLSPGQPAASSATTAAKAAAKAPAPVSVEVAPVQRRSVRPGAGRGQLGCRAKVWCCAPRWAGVVALAFKMASVRRGQTLRVWTTNCSAPGAQAQAEAGVAQTNHQRNQELVAQGLSANARWMKAPLPWKWPRPKLALAQAQLERLRITAPFDGTLGIRQVAVGDYLKTGADIVNLEDMDARCTWTFACRALPALHGAPARTCNCRSMPAGPGLARNTVQAINPCWMRRGRSVAVRLNNWRQQLRPACLPASARNWASAQVH